jgi:hypothetical protein
MTSRSLAVWLVGAIAAILLVSVSTSSAFAGCGTGVELGQASANCVKSGSETHEYIAAHSEHTYSIRPACAYCGTAFCDEPARCNVGGHPGWLFNVFQDADPTPLDWQACLTKQESRQLGALTPGDVQRAYQRLSWPASTLVVQPPKGRTLVNFDTNFFTTNTAPTTQVVTLLGQRVTIEATPTSYTWHFGAGDGDRSTSDPGAAYPDLRVTYRYPRVGTVQPSVDTTYAGRYRIGAGPWRTIPQTLTVAGPSVVLEVVSATPHLMGY